MNMLSAAQVTSAVAYNDRHMAKIGWTRQFHQVAGLVGLGAGVTAEEFTQALSAWQAVQRPRLKADGKLGNTTWGRMRPLLKIAAGAMPVPKWVKIARPRPKQSEIVPLSDIGMHDAHTPWIGVARVEMARWELERATMTAEQRKYTEGHTDLDEGYFSAAPRWGNVTHDLGEVTKKKNRDWCAAFVNHCLHRAGYSHSGSAWAASFASRYRWQFDALEEPQVGCVIVTGPRPGSHVAFLADTRGLPKRPNGDVAVKDLPPGGVKLFGGNQSARVCYKRFQRSLVSARGRNGVVSPYFMPRQGTPNCNIGLPTARPHECHYVHLS